MDKRDVSSRPFRGDLNTDPEFRYVGKHRHSLKHMDSRQDLLSTGLDDENAFTSTWKVKLPSDFVDEKNINSTTKGRKRTTLVHPEPTDDMEKMRSVEKSRLMNAKYVDPGSGSSGHDNGAYQESKGHQEHGKVTRRSSNEGEFSQINNSPSEELNLKRANSVELMNISIHQCARDGNTSLMELLLMNMHGNVGRKINAHDEEENSALHLAARYNHYNMVKMLIKYGADVSDVDEEGSTALHFAARYKRMRLKNNKTESTVENSVILYLVHSSADVNARDIYDCTPLHFAAMRGNEVATKELLSCQGINIESKDKQEMRALHMAASHSEVEICRMLLRQNADIECEDEDKATPLHYCCMEGSVKIAKMLFKAAESRGSRQVIQHMVEDTDNQDNTPLHYAVENKNYDIAKLCIEKGANVNAVRNNYSTPLHLAAVVGDSVGICELLMDNKARKDALDINQCTPMHRAAAFNNVKVVEFLLNRGAAIDKHDKDNFTPLLIAACNGHVDTIRLLLARGANPYHEDKHDKTAIYWAAEEDNLDALEELLNHPEAQKLMDIPDRYDNSPLHIAAQNGYLNCVKCLLDHDAKIDIKNEEERSPIHLAAEAGHTDVVRELVHRNKMVIHSEDEDSNTALHLAALAGHYNMVHALILVGADIEARNSTLWTPLDCAAAKGWAKTCKVLLESDAPIDAMDKSKTTPLHLAASRGHDQVVNLLITSHANVALKNTDNMNCLDLAIESGHKDVAMAIVNSDKWLLALKTETTDEKTGYRITPIRKLIQKMPEVAERVFCRCTTLSSDKPTDDYDYGITFNYEFLDDMYASWNKDSMSAAEGTDDIYDEDGNILPTVDTYTKKTGILKKNHPLSIMVSCDRADLLAHPLVTSLLRHKWNSMGRWVYYMNLGMYSIFLTFLTTYVLTTPSPYSFRNFTGLENVSGSDCEMIYEYSGRSLTQHKAAEVAKYFIMIMAAVQIIREIFQIINAKLHYLGWENLIEWTIYITSFLLVLDFTSCQRITGLRANWQWQLAAVCIFLSWIDLVLFIRKFPMFGIYVVMFTDICFTFLHFFPVLILFIIAFGLALHVLLANQFAFQSVGLSLLKTSVMMIGEIDYGDIFLGLHGVDEDSPDYHNANLYYQGLSFTLFVVFLITMTIIIMNLLVGLAVDDIKAVQEKAALTRLAMQVELALNVESVLPKFIKRKFVVRSKTIYPNRYDNPVKRLVHWDSTFMSSAALSRALDWDPNSDDIAGLDRNIDKMKSRLRTLMDQNKNTETKIVRLENMMKALLVHQGVDFEYADEHNEHP